MATGLTGLDFWALTVLSFTSGDCMIKLRNKKHAFSTFVDSAIPFANQSIREVISPYMTEGEFQIATIVRVNDVPKLRKDWDLPLQDEDVVDIIPVVGELVTAMVVVNLVVLAASLAFAAYGTYKARQAMRALKAGQGQAEADPFFSIDGQSNKANLNNPVEVAYGRNRMWPSYIGRPYRTYRDDVLPAFSEVGLVKNSTFYQIFCIGQGEFDIHKIQIGDIDINSFSGVSVEIIPPGEVSSGVSKIAYNQPDFEEFELAVNGSSDVFKMSPSGISSSFFEIDIEIKTNNSYHIGLMFNVIDKDTGVINLAAGDFYYEFDRETKYWDRSPPHRNTFTVRDGLDPSLRYCCKVYNLTDSNTISVVGLRSFPTNDFKVEASDKTLLVVTYVALEFYNQIKDKVNVIATRKLKTLISSFAGTTITSVTQPTRSIPWAFYDVLTNPVYGGGLSEDFIDINKLMELNETLAAQGLFFDNVFNQTTTVEDACKVIAAAGRCSIAYNGSKLTLVQDVCSGPAEAMFSAENIVDGSFQWSSEMFDPTEPDAVEASYVETDSGKTNTVLFIPENSTGNNVQKISITGIDRTTAWREAAHKMRRLQLVRDTFKFKTGMEGYIPTVGATAMLSWDLTAMGESGYVEGYTAGWLYLSRAISVATGAVRARIALRRDDGSVMGPFDIVSVVNVDSEGRYKSVNIGDIDFDIDFWRTDREPVHFVAWAGSGDIPVNTKIQIESVTPTDDGFVDITATNYDPKVYEFDSYEPPADEYEPIDSEGIIPVVPWVKVGVVKTPINSESKPYVLISWGSCFGASFYRLYVDSIKVWEGYETYKELSIASDVDTFIEVSAVNETSEGSKTTKVVSIGQSASTVQIDFADNGVAKIVKDGIFISWGDVPNADYFQYRVLLAPSLTVMTSWIDCDANNAIFTKSEFRRTFATYVDFTTASVDLVFQVRAFVEGSYTAAFEKDLTIPVPYSPTGVVISQDVRVVISTTLSGATDQYRRKRTIKWQPSSNYSSIDSKLTYRVYAQVYIEGVGSTTPKINLWSLIHNSEDLQLTTDAALNYDTTSADEYLFENAVLYTHPIHGSGVKFNAVESGAPSLTPDEVIPNGICVFSYVSTPNPKMATLIQAGQAFNLDDYFIPGFELADISGCKFVIPRKACSLTTGVQKLKGFVIADNGFFISETVSRTSFTVDA